MILFQLRANKSHKDKNRKSFKKKWWTKKKLLQIKNLYMYMKFFLLESSIVDFF